MDTILDVVICLDCSSSMTSNLNDVRSKLVVLVEKILSNFPNKVRFGLIEFQTYGNSVPTLTRPFTSSIAEFQEWLNYNRVENRHSGGGKAIAAALAVSQRFDWDRNHDEPALFHEKLVLLITDGPPNGLLTDENADRGQYIWQMGQKLVEDNIVLLVAGIEPDICVCEDFYCALANQTGGEYVPFNNVMRILPGIMKKCIVTEYTLSQIFRQLDMKMDIEYNSLYRHRYIEKRVRYLIEKCSKMVAVRKEFRYTEAGRNLLKENIVGEDEDSDDHDDVSSYQFPAYYEQHVFSFEFENGLTPTTDDEGYRSRLLTTTSLGSSYRSTNSPCFLPLSDDDLTNIIEL